jgi:cytochrome bd-type quinol oxidase subunit 2
MPSFFSCCYNIYIIKVSSSLSPLSLRIIVSASCHRLLTSQYTHIWTFHSAKPSIDLVVHQLQQQQQQRGSKRFPPMAQHAVAAVTAALLLLPTSTSPRADMMPSSVAFVFIMILLLLLLLLAVAVVFPFIRACLTRSELTADRSSVHHLVNHIRLLHFASSSSSPRPPAGAMTMPPPPVTEFHLHGLVYFSRTKDSKFF